MERISRNIGIGLYSVLKQNKISVEEAAEKVGYSVRDMWRIIEGRLFLSPRALEELAGAFGTSAEHLINYKPSEKTLLPELEYNKDFTDKDHLYMIIDLF